MNGEKTARFAGSACGFKTHQLDCLLTMPTQLACFDGKFQTLRQNF